MKAIVYEEYGAPDVLEPRDVEKPELTDDGVMVRGRAIAVINGASGGVGTFAVHLAKSYGAEVTVICSTRNVELVRSIGADHVVEFPTRSAISAKGTPAARS